MKKFAIPALAALALAACADSTPEETTVEADTTVVEPMPADTATPMPTDTATTTPTESPTPTDTATPM